MIESLWRKRQGHISSSRRKETSYSLPLEISLTLKIFSNQRNVQISCVVSPTKVLSSSSTSILTAATRLLSWLVQVSQCTFRCLTSRIKKQSVLLRAYMVIYFVTEFYHG